MRGRLYSSSVDSVYTLNSAMHNDNESWETKLTVIKGNYNCMYDPKWLSRIESTGTVIRPNLSPCQRDTGQLFICIYIKVKCTLHVSLLVIENQLVFVSSSEIAMTKDRNLVRSKNTLFIHCTFPIKVVWACTFTHSRIHFICCQ